MGIEIADALAWLGKPALNFGWRTIAAQWNLSDQMDLVNRSYQKVRDELAEVGLLYEPENEEDGGYLDQIELVVAELPSLGEAGYVFEEVPWFAHLVGYREGTIYLPADLPRDAFVPGGTLTDVIRHEFAHAWHWLEPDFFERGWFEEAFGGEYMEETLTPRSIWEERMENDDDFAFNLADCHDLNAAETLARSRFHEDFVSDYAATYFCEDFAETFMTYLRFRNSLSKFEHRKGVFAKLKAVESAVEVARLELGIE